MFSISIHATRSLPPSFLLLLFLRFEFACSYSNSQQSNIFCCNFYIFWLFFCCTSLVFSIPLFAKSNARAKDLPGVAGERVKPAEAQLANTFCTALSFPWGFPGIFQPFDASQPEATNPLAPISYDQSDQSGARCRLWSCVMGSSSKTVTTGTT